jgi:hypothetical protein
MSLVAVIDGFGVYGHYLHYGCVILFVGGALIIFLYLWQKGRLDMDEEAKYQMMKKEDREDKHDRA